MKTKNSEESLRRVRALTGCAPERLVFHQIDLCDAAALNKMLETCPDFYACIHFAGLKVPPSPHRGACLQCLVWVSVVHSFRPP